MAARVPNCAQVLAWATGLHQELVQVPSIPLISASTARFGERGKWLLGAWPGPMLVGAFLRGCARRARPSADSKADAAILLRGGLTTGAGGVGMAVCVIGGPPPGRPLAAAGRERGGIRGGWPLPPPS